MKRCLFCATAFAGACMISLCGCGSSDLAEAMGAGAFSKVYDISGNYKSLDLKTDISDITIQTGDTPSLEVHMDKWYKIEDVTEGDTLYLTEKNDGPFWQKWFHFSSVHNSLILTLPENYVEQLIVSTDVGDVEISGLVTGQLVLEADTGDVKIEDSVTGTLTADLDTGNAGLTGLTAAFVHVSSDTGDILLEVSGGNDINLASDTGDIRVTVSGSQDEYNYNVTNDVGDSVIGDSRIEGSGASYIVSNGTKKNITISNDTGDILIDFQ